MLQLPYGEYLKLLERKKQAEQILQARDQVLEELQRFLLDGKSLSAVAPAVIPEAVPVESPLTPAVIDIPEPLTDKKVRLEFSASDYGDIRNDGATGGRLAGHGVVPSVKKEIAEHFNLLDESGRLFNVFMQYYTCLNESCGGIVRVTMKDGVCSLWNYDAWEEFGFVDVMEGGLRFSLDLRYEDNLSELEYCDVPRLLSLRRKVTSIRIADLNKTMLSVLTMAFHEVGLTMS
ncbi:MAG: hypothetical protein JXR25_15175 [Pontiellaceae bacterium]|nr:hypothetical protein [Pontiellaceae bacterium]MBN2786162.1 hypothetical protein [Pontiellaceae bacterium]